MSMNTAKPSPVPRPYPQPRPKPPRGPRPIKDAVRAQREAELDEAIERCRPAMQAAATYWAAQGMDLAHLLCPAQALAMWSGRPQAVVARQRHVIF